MSSNHSLSLPRTTYELGEPMPPSEHAVSVALPRWEHVVKYEEKDPAVMGRLQVGYPRFFVHRLVDELGKQIEPDGICLPFPSATSAETCAQFVRRRSGATARAVHKEVGGHQVWGVATVSAGGPALREFWQHTGLIFSSRHAKSVLAGNPVPAEAPEIWQALRRQLAAFYDCEEADVFLQATGMAAQYAALRIAAARRPGKRTAQLGFPYVDTLKLQQKAGVGGVLLHRLDMIEPDLKELLAKEELAACFCEIPGNPLLGSADLRRITPALRQKGVPLVADDVVATPYNVDLSGHADLIATSLTKFIAGTCDVMGGALICNPRSPYHDELGAIARAQHEELLWWEDAARLEQQAHGFPERMQRHNENGLLLAERLRHHPAIEKVWYPRWEFAEAYEAVRRPRGGWGALVTFLPRNAPATAADIYDRLSFCKGPSLGTVFTLACPFTLLAHYTELEWAEACGVSRHLIRLSAGLEEPERLWATLCAALEGRPEPAQV